MASPQLTPISFYILPPTETARHSHPLRLFVTCSCCWWCDKIDRLCTLSLSVTTSRCPRGRRGRESHDITQESLVDKSVASHIPNNGAEISSKNTRASKRVVAPGVQEQPIRVTRRRSATINQESNQNIMAGILSDSCDATNQDCIQHISTVVQPSSPIETESEDPTGDQGE
ncbi:hypothetical protein ZEAMMB73_Zm00001d031862 [Zea mays]|uniref:Uncharacterized protein n=1 Tax=Zea mays TaxID=4577 RepID=A0A1D6KLT2_MAIZE|nr:hypothetical protein ZEAMMB73_Zm00001d031862 [Zea mays]